MKDTILTYTANDVEFIKTKGCDKSWVLNKNRAENCTYLVCCHSRGANKRSAFLVGRKSKIRYVCIDDSGNKRWAIEISEYATIDLPDVWEGWHNPVHYTTLEDLGINPSTLKFEKIQKVEKQTETEIQPLSIEQAKEGISKKFDIAPEQIEIVIKG